MGDRLEIICAVSLYWRLMEFVSLWFQTSAALRPYQLIIKALKVHPGDKSGVAAPKGSSLTLHPNSFSQLLRRRRWRRWRRCQAVSSHVIDSISREERRIAWTEKKKRKILPRPPALVRTPGRRYYVLIGEKILRTNTL